MQKDKNLLEALCIISLIVCFVVLKQKNGTACNAGSSILPQIIHEQDPLSVKNKSTYEKREKQFMIVFVHGTILPVPSPYSLLDVTREFFARKKSIGQSFYNNYLNALRFNSFYRHQPIGDVGLHAIVPYYDSFKGSYACWEAADIYEKIYRSCISSNELTHLAFYTFGWQGDLHQETRKEWAEIFYHALSDEIDRRKKTLRSGEILEVIIAAHSHGGNVALHLADVEKDAQKNLLIDKLVLFGIPVQSETSACVQSPIFKKIYNIYSHGDAIQLMDVISSRDFQPKRRFDEKGVDSGKLVQIEIEIKDKKPSHFELWAFSGDDNIFYRKHLSISPLPVFVFMPVIIDAIEQHMVDVKNIHLNIEKRNEGYHFVFRPYGDKLGNQAVVKPYDYAFPFNFDTIRDQIGMILRE